MDIHEITLKPWLSYWLSIVALKSLKVALFHFYTTCSLEFLVELELVATSYTYGGGKGCLFWYFKKITLFAELELYCTQKAGSL